MAIRKPKQTEDNFVKALNPRDADTKHMGEEPFFPLQPDSDRRFSTLARAFTWYHRFYGKKMQKNFCVSIWIITTARMKLKNCVRYMKANFCLHYVGCHV